MSFFKRFQLPLSRKPSVKTLSAANLADAAGAGTASGTPSSVAGGAVPMYGLESAEMQTLDVLCAGVTLMKLDRKSGSSKDRVFKLDILRRHFRWSSKRKPRELTTINVHDITELRTELSFVSTKAVEFNERCLSIHYLHHGEPKILDLVLPTPQLRTVLVAVLEGLRSELKALDGRDYIEFLINTWIQRAWAATDADENGRVELDETLEALKSFNVALSKDQIRRLFGLYDRKQGWLDFDAFSRLCMHLKRSPEVVRAFDLVTGGVDGSGKLDLPRFAEFLRSTQRETSLDDEQIAALFHSFAVPAADVEGGWALDAMSFHIYLLSPQNAALDCRTEAVHMDMTQPLAHYFISSSHNTYLVGNQLNSESSVEAYVRALQRGCRCVEVDCWDGPHDEPVVYHGHTRTTKILFRDVVVAVQRYAFVASEFPLILSLEMHCGYAQQGKIAYYLKSILGPALVTARLNENEAAIPSPESLKHRILVKGKSYPSPSSSSSSGAGADDDASESMSKSRSTFARRQSSALFASTDASMTDSPLGTEAPTSPTTATSDPQPIPVVAGNGSSDQLATAMRALDLNNSSSNGSPSAASSPAAALATSPPASGAAASSSIHPDLAALAVYARAVKFSTSTIQELGSPSAPAAERTLPRSDSVPSTTTLVSAAATTAPSFCYMSSFSESAYLKHARAQLSGMIGHTAHRLARVYPAGTRVGSSNYNPFPHWAGGAQIVALNWQTFDTGMAINAGFFAQNGGCGYVLKPAYMRDAAAVRPVGVKLRVKILCGHHLPKSKDKVKGEVIDPYVVVEIYDAPVPAPLGSPTSASAPTSSSVPGSSPPLQAAPAPTPDSPNGTAGDASRISEDPSFVYRTETVQNNGWNPPWNESFTAKVHNADLSLIRFTVYDKDVGTSDFLGSWAAPVKCLRQGYRHLYLRNWKGKQSSDATILVHIVMEPLK
ncbi:hypothetical protein H9P43_005778 [Blastocladiella emersonii ATCC 22665]|nr:hypothetical protein H9P43_005778 [Blastocladiella emersonii ATCC 22665]